MGLSYWVVLLMTVGVTWTSGALCLAFSNGEYLRAWQAVISIPVIYLLAVNIQPKWRSKTGQQLAGVAHLALLVFAVTMVLLGRVPLSENAWWRRVGAAAGAVACVYELVRLRRGSNAEQALEGKVAVSGLSAGERDELAVLAASMVDPARSERIFRELIAANAAVPLWHEGLAQALSSQQKYAEAISVLERAPVPRYAVALQLATAYFGLRDDANAAEHARKAAALAGNDEEKSAAEELLRVIEQRSRT